jgi:hypothetical protein
MVVTVVETLTMAIVGVGSLRFLPKEANCTSQGKVRAFLKDDPTKYGEKPLDPFSSL